VTLPAALVRRIDAVNRAHPWSHNDHHHPWILRQVPPGARRALDVGCGTGGLVRVLATVVPDVTGIDPDERVVALAGRRCRVGDLLSVPPEPAYDLVTAVAVVHHLPPAAALTHLRALLRPGGRLLVVGCYRASTPTDHLVGLVAVPANLAAGLARSRHAPAARVAMSAPTAAPRETLPQLRAIAAAVLPGARIRRRLFWRYTLTYQAPPVS
jgi:SAM-dependent methyltransferase